MKSFIKPVALAMMLLFAGASFAQGNHPAARHHYKHHKHKHHKFHRKHHTVHHYHQATPPPPPVR